ncbi:MAG: 2-amino-4-hydroxy-6-hydroxymethyldihydropteridine diphosphokinase [Gammaproteobacteria bacterium]
MSEITAYIGLGSNLEDPIQQVRTALRELDQIKSTKLIKHSSLYKSDPVGPAGQPDYINAVAEIKTRLKPMTLLHALQSIEQDHQRVRLKRWGPRTLDLDLLIYADQKIDEPDLIVPHIMIAERSFVLYPLAEIAPDIQIPELPPMSDLLKNVSEKGLSKLLSETF